MPTNVRREDDGEPPVLAAGVLVHPLAVAPKHLRTIEEQTAPSTPFFKPQPTARVAFDLMLLDDPAVVAVDTEAVHEPFVPAERTNFFDFDDDRVTLGGTANAPDETMALETSLLDSDVPADLQITAVHEEFGQLQRADSDELSMASAAMGLATAGDEDNVIKSPPPPPSKNFFDDEPAMAATAPSNVDFLLGTEVPSASSASGRKTEQGETGGESQ